MPVIMSKETSTFPFIVKTQDVQDEKKATDDINRAEPSVAELTQLLNNSQDWITKLRMELERQKTEASIQHAKLRDKLEETLKELERERERTDKLDFQIQGLEIILSDTKTDYFREVALRKIGRDPKSVQSPLYSDYLLDNEVVLSKFGLETSKDRKREIPASTEPQGTSHKEPSKEHPKLPVPFKNKDILELAEVLHNCDLAQGHTEMSQREVENPSVRILKPVSLSRRLAHGSTNSPQDRDYPIKCECLNFAKI